jgi:hypothetical protein
MSARRRLPLGPDLGPAIDRLRDIAARSRDTLLLAEGPLQPDWELLDLCAEALHLLTAAESVYAARQFFHLPTGWERFGAPRPWTDAERQADAEAMAEHFRLTRRAVLLMRRIKKISATSPAAIYAKALLVRASRTGAKELAISLAEDMVACPALRATLWPAAGLESGTSARPASA